jgi:hypothetical protein
MRQGGGGGDRVTERTARSAGVPRALAGPADSLPAGKLAGKFLISGASRRYFIPLFQKLAAIPAHSGRESLQGILAPGPGKSFAGARNNQANFSPLTKQNRPGQGRYLNCIIY